MATDVYTPASVMHHPSVDSMAMEDPMFETMPSFQSGIQAASMQLEEGGSPCSALSVDNPFRSRSTSCLSPGESGIKVHTDDNSMPTGVAHESTGSPGDTKKARKSITLPSQRNLQSQSLPRKVKVQTDHSDSDSDRAPSRASLSGAYSALARRGFKKLQQAMARRSAGRAKSFTNLVSMMRKERESGPELLRIEDAPHVEQCPEPDYNEGLLVAPASPANRTFSTGTSSASEQSGDDLSHAIFRHTHSGAAVSSHSDVAASSTPLASGDGGEAEGGGEADHLAWDPLPCDPLPCDPLPCDPLPLEETQQQHGDGSREGGMHGRHAASVRFQRAVEMGPLGEGQVHSMQHGSPQHRSTELHVAADGGSACAARGQHGGRAALSEEQLRHVAKIMEQAGVRCHLRAGALRNAALRDLLALASARILLMPALDGGHLRSMVLEALGQDGFEPVGNAGGSSAAVGDVASPDSRALQDSSRSHSRSDPGWAGGYAATAPVSAPSGDADGALRAGSSAAARGRRLGGHEPPWETAPERLPQAPERLPQAAERVLQAAAALVAPAAALQEAGPLPRPPFRLLTDTPVAGTLRRGRAWSARARTLQSHACLLSAVVPPDAAAAAGPQQRSRSSTDSIEQMAPAAAMLVRRSGSFPRTFSPRGAAGLSGGAGPVFVEPVRPVEDAGVRVHGGLCAQPAAGAAAGSRPTMEEIAHLVQQSRLWWPAALREHKASSMPHSSTAPDWHGLPIQSEAKERDGQTGSIAASAAASDSRNSRQEHCAGATKERAQADVVTDGAISPGAETVSSHVYSGVLDMERDEFILDSSKSERPSDGRLDWVGGQACEDGYIG
eukprot:jgi/Ulvmu1/10368/UM061_0051.1